MARMKHTKKKRTKRGRVVGIRKKGHILNLENVRYKSPKGKALLRLLHKSQGSKGYVKIPGKRKVRIIDKHLRRKARGRSRTRANILAMLRRKYNKKKSAKKSKKRIKAPKNMI